jgi:outer membrane biosynthesis protein TonB
MRQTTLPLLLTIFLIATALGQSGRKGANPKPSVTPTTSGRVDTSPTPPVAARELPTEIDGDHIYKSKEIDEPFQILKKPEPSYTRAGQRHKTKGLVVLRLILAADETIKHIEVVKGLPDGLTDKSIEAAQKIKFKPAKKDGKPVSVWVEVEYGFNIY